MVRYTIQLILLAKIGDIEELLLAATVPIRLCLHFVADGAAINHRRAVRVVIDATSSLIFDLLHIEAVFVADLLI